MEINPEPKNPASQPPNILVVGDTPANLQLLSGMLKDRGYKVRPVSSGPEALQAAGRIAPDLILLDINMPGMNGYEVCQCLKADPALKEVPVLFISALNETADKVKAFGAGGLDYVNKPFEFAEALCDADIVRRIIGNSLGNALKFTPKEGQINTSVARKEKKLGIGLGLTFCKLAIEAHGGRIGLDSQIGQGSTFWFTLPL